MRDRRAGTLALATGVITIWALPTASLGQGEQVRDVLDRAVKDVATVAAPADPVLRPVADAASRARAVARAAAPAAKATPRAPTATPQTDPPLHGTNPHGQGTVGVVDLTPSSERPLGGDPDGSDAGPEEVVAGRARGEQRPDGTYHGHITIAALFGNEVLGVDTNPGQTQNGPLQPVQTNVLDAVCNGSAQQICLSVLTADSATTSTGSTNRFAVARGQLGGANGIGFGAAESQGDISQDANCQTSTGSSRTANVSAGGGAVANAANSSSTSRSCRGQAPEVTNTSQVIGLGGTNVPIPAPGCADGTPDTVTGIPTLLPIVCNADTVQGAGGVRDALDVFVLAVGGTTLARESTASSESVSTAPPAPETAGPACSDGADNDGDGRVDIADPGCHSDGNADNPASFNPNDTSEADAGTGGNADTGGSGNAVKPQCSDGRDNDGDGVSDRRDPGCHSDGNPGNPASFDPDDDSERDGRTVARVTGSSTAQCADGQDNDGDGVSDARDPGCHSDGDASNPASYDPNDDSEGSARAAGLSGSLPNTGADLVGLALAGVLLVGGGLLLRRRGGLPTAR